MITDEQYRRLLMNKNTRPLYQASDKAGMSEGTARKYLKAGFLPSELKKEHNWETRKNPFIEVWPLLKDKLETNPGLESKTLFDWLCREYPGKFQEGQLRTLQRHIKKWRATDGPSKEIYFTQKHYPGRLCESDFTHMKEVGIVINGELFDHLMYHFVLTYSNWETGSICFSESFEALSEGLQNALWNLGGVPLKHKTDQLSAAVQKIEHPEEFTERYKALLSHYNIEGLKIQAGKPNENGDIEQRNYRFKKAVKQALLLRGSNNFESIKEYKIFLDNLFIQLNSGRIERLKEEIQILKQLPLSKLDVHTKLKGIRVNQGSTINVLRNIYSVPSKLIGEAVDIYVFADYLEIWYAQKKIETLPRLKGRANHDIQYRHVIDSLLRKPGAFENYRYKTDMFPTVRFRIAYDTLKKQNRQSADRIYLKILYLAAKGSEKAIDLALAVLLENNQSLTIESIKKISAKSEQIKNPADVQIAPVSLKIYDNLFSNTGGEI